jgi:hypothetical protein
MASHHPTAEMPDDGRRPAIVHATDIAVRAATFLLAQASMPTDLQAGRLHSARANRTTTCRVPNSCQIPRATAVTHG